MPTITGNSLLLGVVPQSAGLSASAIDLVSASQLSAQILAVAPSGPAGILLPGQSGQPPSREP
jgi:hypothetical protein